MAEVDHIFICAARGAPAAERLIEFGLGEGPPNRHPGQGTANRRFFFDNFMLELLWLEDAAEAQSDETRRTLLWERWSAGSSASPFGIILRPSAADESCPFEAWRYAPSAMPGLVLEIASSCGIDEPMWCYLNAGRSPKGVGHAAGLHELTGIRLCGPLPAMDSVTAAMARRGVVSLAAAEERWLELEWDGRPRGERTDFRPALPLVFWR